MPKENYTIAAFHGGLNNASDPRDIRNEDLSAATGLDVSKVGKVVMMKDQRSSDANHSTLIESIQPGHGFFYYRTDASGKDAVTSNTTWLNTVQQGNPGQKAEYQIDPKSIPDGGSEDFGGADTSCTVKFQHSTESAVTISNTFDLQPESTMDTIISTIISSINLFTYPDPNLAGVEFAAQAQGEGIILEANAKSVNGNGVITIVDSTDALDTFLNFTIIQVQQGEDNLPQINDIEFGLTSDLASAGFTSVEYNIVLNDSTYKLTSTIADDIIGLIQRVFMGSTVVHSGTAQNQSGTPATTSIRLAATASDEDSYYNGMTVTITAGQNALEERTISAYDAASHANGDNTATVSVAFSGSCNSTSVYEIRGANLHSTYKNGSIFSALTGSRVLKDGSGAEETNGIDGNTDFSCSLNVVPDIGFNVSLLANYDFNDPSGGADSVASNWVFDQFAISGRSSAPIATFANSGDGYLKQDVVPIEANKLYQLRFTIASAELELTFKDYAASNTYVAEDTYPIGTHTVWFYNTTARVGLYINCEDDGSGAGSIANIELTRVSESIRITAATSIDFPIDVFATVTNSEQYTGNRWLGVVDKQSNLHTYSSSGNSWSTPVSLGTGSNCKASYYYVDGALRIADGNSDLDASDVQYNANNQPKWYGFVERYYFGTSSAGYSTRANFFVNGFVNANVSLTALVIKDINMGGAPTAPDVSSPIGIEFTNVSGTGSTWAVGGAVVYDVAVTTLYDDSKQESALNVSSETLSVAQDNKLRAKFSAFAKAESGLHVNHRRVSGFNIYMRENGKTDWFLQWEVDIEKGIRAFKTGDHVIWISGATDNAACISAYLLDPRGIETYEIMTGHDQLYTSVSLDASGNGFKSAIVANRRAWIAAPSMQDDLGNTVTLGDTMVKSNVNQFDSFTLDNRVDVAIRDGEDIVAIAEFGDRILQFKHQTLYIINISQDFEFLEGTYRYKGIMSHAAQCKTDYGIAWINKSGCYLYDGKQIRNLLEKNNIDVVDTKIWSNFIEDTSMIGYSPNDKQLIIVKRSVADGDITSNDIFVYNLVIGSWTRGTDKWPSVADKSNFLTDWNGNLSICNGTPDNITEWGYPGIHSEKYFDLTTRDVDLGKPAIRKKVYKIYITYKCSSSPTNVQVQYYINGGSTAYNFNPANNATLSGSISVLDGSKSDWTIAELKPSTSGEANNIYSIKLRLFNASNASPVPKEFEVNDISIIHRRKSIK